VHISVNTLPLKRVRIAESDHPLLRVIEVDRSSATVCADIPELKTSGLYLLLTEATPAGEILTIGTTEALSTLFHTWAQAPIPWSTALLITGRFGALSLPQLAALQGRLLDTLNCASSLQDVALSRAPPAMDAGAQSICDAAYTGVKQLIEVLGHSLFSSANDLSPVVDALYHCIAGSVIGKARRCGPEFIVLKDSVGQRTSPADLSSVSALQRALIETGIVQVRGESLIFLKDHAFTSPAHAASALLGRSTSGFLDWKSAEGRALAQIERYLDVADEPQPA
jgi:hypothetical protein